MHAKDIMSAPAHTVRADAPLTDAAALLQRLSITSAPVVDAGGELVGMISESDLLRQQLAGAKTGGGGRRVRDAMSRRPVTAWPDADVVDVAAVMVRQDEHTVPVVVEEHVVGVVSRCDVLRTVLPTDVSAQQEAQRRLDAFAGGLQRWPVTVEHAAAVVGGAFDDATQRAVAEALVRTTAGVGDVRIGNQRP